MQMRQMGFIQIFRCCISNAKKLKNARGRQTKIRKNAGKIRGGQKVETQNRLRPAWRAPLGKQVNTSHINESGSTQSGLLVAHLNTARLAKGNRKIAGKLRTS